MFKNRRSVLLEYAGSTSAAEDDNQDKEDLKEDDILKLSIQLKEIKMNTDINKKLAHGLYKRKAYFDRTWFLIINQ